MARCITKQDVTEVSGFKIDGLTNVKGNHIVTETIKNAMRRGARIACIGGQGTGKTLALKVILAEAIYFEEDTTMDEPITEREFKTANSNRIQYLVATAESAEELMNILKEKSKKDLVLDVLVITRAADLEHGKYIKSVDEITSFDGVNVVNNLVSIHKNRYIKNADLSLKGINDL